MFKKTLIAAAVATLASSVAMADVSVSGRIEQGFSDEDAGTTGWAGFNDNQINIKASEDLGNGMSAFGQLSMRNTGAEMDSKLGVKGSFGTVVLGRMEDFSEGVVAATQSTMGTNEGELGAQHDRTNSGMAYVSPTINGLHFGVAGFAGLTPTSNLDAIDLIIAYDNGPLSVKLARENTDGTQYDVAAVAPVAGKYITSGGVSTTTVGENQVLIAPVTFAAATTGSDHKVTSLSIGYSMADLSGSALWVKEEGGTSGNVDATDLMVRLDYKMGANKLTLQHAKDESNTSAAAADVDTNIVELSHAFSKRTTAYIGFADSDSAAKENTYVGMQHTF
jgi:predicted porin